MTTPEPRFTQDEIDQLFSRAYEGDIDNSSKVELERYAAMLCSGRARSHGRDPEFAQLGETVRTLLIVRMSEEANKEAKWVSILALWIAGAALLVSLVQAASSLWPLIFKT